MPVYFRFGIGPFRSSTRLTRTQAQKRAAAQQRATRLQAREEAREARFDPRKRVKVTQTPVAVSIDADLRGLAPDQADQVVAYARKLEADNAHTPWQMPANTRRVRRAAPSTPSR